MCLIAGLQLVHVWWVLTSRGHLYCLPRMGFRSCSDSHDRWTALLSTVDVGQGHLVHPSGCPVLEPSRGESTGGPPGTVLLCALYAFHHPLQKLVRGRKDDMPFEHPCPCTECSNDDALFRCFCLRKNKNVFKFYCHSNQENPNVHK